MAKLNAKQKKFCREYIKDLNASQACVRAGYAKNSARITGAKLLTNANIQEYIKELQAKIKSKDIADIEEVRKVLTNIIRGNDLDERYYTEAGVLVKRAIKSQNNRLKAIETLCKLQGYYDDGTKVNITNNNVAKIENELPLDDLSPDELRKIIDEVKER